MSTYKSKKLIIGLFASAFALAVVSFSYIGYLAASAIHNHEVEVFGVGGEDIEEDIQELNLELNRRRDEIEKLKEQAEEFRKQIISQRNEAFSLKNQISILDTHIARINVESKAKEQEIELTKLDIIETHDEIKIFEGDIAHQKEKIAEILRLIYQNDEKSYLEILLLNDSLADFFNAAKYIENLHDGLHDKLVDLKEVKGILDESLLSLNEKQHVLEEQKVSLREQQVKLEQQEYVKEELLTETRESEKTFRSLLEELKGEQESIDSEIVNLEKSIRKKLEEQERSQALGSLSGEGLTWPVPKNTITAFFHDPSYPYRYVFEHPAIDIRAGQGTTVKAAASGYVAKTRPDPSCTGRYSYIMIIHADGLSTVYGHMNSIEISEGQFVVKGQRIGLSGGLPGTCGSGRLTTGPHHHFEVRLNGIPVDPLNYLK
jgi:murein DD-endopeptidase MepM/ murein hydrolase activator NlpD